MFTLKEACAKILRERPGQYIHCVNEYDKSFEFFMVPDGMTIGNLGGCLCSDAVDKEDGKVRYTSMADELFRGNYKQYSSEDIEKLLL